MQTQEHIVIQECQSGNFSRFAFLYDAYVQKIYRFIYYKTHHKETAEDLVSLVFMKALENIASYSSHKAAFATWLYQIARNSVIDHYRTAKPSAAIEDIWDMADTTTDIVRDLDMKMKSEKIMHAMKTLSPRYREIITMRVWQGLSYKEIAEATDTTEDAAKMAFSRALKTARKVMPSGTIAYLILFS